MSRPRPPNAAVPRSDGAEGRQPPSRRRVPAERHGDGAEHDDLHDLDDEDRGDLGGEQPGPAERGHAEALQHAVLALEGGADRRLHHAGRQDRQGQHAGGQEVDGVLDAVGQRQHVDAARRRRAAPAGCRATSSTDSPRRAVSTSSTRSCASERRHRSPPVRRRNTSSSRRRPARRSASGQLALGQPRRDGGDVRRCRRHADHVLAGRRPRAPARPGRRRGPPRRARAGARRRCPRGPPPSRSSAGGAVGDDPTVVDDDDPVGEPLGLVEVVGREQRR